MYRVRIIRPIFAFLVAGFAVSCANVTAFFDGNEGLVAVYLQSPSSVKTNIPDFQQCRSLQGGELSRCLAQNYCATRSGEGYSECVNGLSRKLGLETDGKRKKRGEKERWKVGYHEHDYEYDHDHEDDDEPNASFEPIKINAEIDSVSIYSETNGWVKVGRETEHINLLNVDLNVKIGQKNVPAGKYTQVRIEFSNHNTLWVHRSMLPDGPTSPATLRGDYYVFPLTYAAQGDNIFIVDREFVVDDPTSINDLTVLELDVVLDPGRSIDSLNGVFTFLPQGNLATISGGGYVQPDQPINTALDGGSLTVTAPAGVSSEPIRIAATPLTQTSLPAALPEPLLLKAYDMQPGQVFQQAVTLTMNYNPSALRAAGYTEDNIRVSYFNESSNEWTYIPSFSVDPVLKQITIHTNHFTIISATAGPGFRLQVPGAVSTKVNFDFFNYVLKNIVPSYMPLVVLENEVLSEAGSNYSIDFKPKNISVRDLSMQIAAGGTLTYGTRTFTGLKLRIATKRPVPLGRLTTTFSTTSGGTCSTTCSKYFSWWGFLEKVCTSTCSALVTHHGKQVRDYTISDLAFSVYLVVIKDNATGALSFQWVGSSPADVFKLTHTVVSSTGDVLSSIILDIANAQIDIWKGVLFDVTKTAVGIMTGNSLTRIFAGSVPNVENFTIDPQGIAYTQTLDTYNVFQNVSNFSNNCAAPPVLTVPNSGAPLPFQFTGANHIGVGIALNGFNELFTEFANRGYFCYNGPGNLNGDVLQMTPAAPVELQYRNHYTLAVTFPMAIQYASQSATGPISFLFRVKPGIGLSGITFEFYGLEHGFQGSFLEAPLDYYLTQLRQVIVSNPGYFSLQIPGVTPAGYTGLQKSMVRIDEPLLGGNRLNIEARLEGLKYDYKNGNTQSEWLWMNSYVFETRGCYPHMKGVLKAAATNVYALIRSDGTLLPIVNDSVNMALLQSRVGSGVALEGYCVKGVFHAKNLIDDLFYLSSIGDSLVKRNYAPQGLMQVPAAFATTIGIYPFDVIGDATPEILQITNESGSLSFRWYLSNTFNATAPSANTVVQLAPPEIQAERGIYRVVMNPDPFIPSPHLLINCTVYSVAASSSAVTLTKQYDACVDRPTGWVWAAGSSQPDSVAVYETLGVESALATPGSRYLHNMWIVGNTLWLFGGSATDTSGTRTVRNDLWRYNSVSGKWTWVDGSSTGVQPVLSGAKGVPSSANDPGSRELAASTVMNGMLWLFGGTGTVSTGMVPMNDLWQYNPQTGQWTWVSGGSPVAYGTRGVPSVNNAPPARSGAMMWGDPDGNIWVFGGEANGGGFYNDLWKFNSVTGEWTWVSGSSVVNQPGAYGAQGVSDLNNTPGARSGGAIVEGPFPRSFVLYGGAGVDGMGHSGVLDDIWRFDTATGLWTWIGGSNSVNTKSYHGTLGVPSVLNSPGARVYHSLAKGNGVYWLYGGKSMSGYTNDLWKFDVSSGTWTWLAGSDQPNATGSYGTLNVSDPANAPSARAGQTMGIDPSGDLWLFGGVGLNPTSPGAHTLGDLWMFHSR